MNLKLLFALITLTTVLACATAQQPKFKFTRGTRIGIVNHLEGSLKDLPRSDIEKLEPLIIEYAVQAVENAMVKAILLPPE
jgi:hypothetical protein